MSKFLSFIQAPYVAVVYGMMIQATIAGFLGSAGLIELSALQQITAAGVFLIITFVVFLFAGVPFWQVIGMALQAFLSTVLELMGVMPVSITQQYVFAGMYLFILIVLWVVLVFLANNSETSD